MDLVVSPIGVTFNTQSGGNAPLLQPGQVIDALVLRLIDATRAQLSVANTVFEVQTQVPLVAGQTVHLAVKNTPDGIKLVLLPGAGNHMEQPAAPAAAGSAAAGTARAPVEARPAAAPSEITASPANPALATAVRAAASIQSGQSPVFADAAAATMLRGMPEPVRQAALQLLSLRTGLDAKLTSDDVKQAFARSGLFLEQNLAAASRGTAVPPSPAQDLKAAMIVFRQVLATALAGGADTKQTPGLARSPTPATAATSAPPEAPVRAPVAGPQSIYRAVAQSVPADDAATLANAVLRTVSALGPSLAPETSGLAADPSLKGIPTPAPPADPAAATETSQPAGQGGPAGPADAPALRPPPPYRGAAPVAQPQAAATIETASPRDAAKMLFVETDQALARHTLLQAASLPDRADLAQAHTDPTAARWMFEVPFATPQGTAMAQFEIARDGHGRPAEGIKPVWRARFSLDVEPMGPVHAQIALVGSRAAVTLWAERPDSAARLRDATALLSDGLRAAELEPGDVLVRGGAPPRSRESTAPAGRFLDRAS